MLGQQDGNATRDRDELSLFQVPVSFPQQTSAASNMFAMLSAGTNSNESDPQSAALGTSSLENFGGSGLGPGITAPGSAATGDEAATTAALQQIAAMIPGMQPQHIQAMYQEYAVRQFAALQALAAAQGANNVMVAAQAGNAGMHGVQGPNLGMAGAQGISGAQGFGSMPGGPGNANRGHFQKNSRGNNTERHAFYKTRICTKWREGSCAYGNNCHYAHGTHELRMPGTNDRPPSGAPMDKRMLINMMKKTRLCQDFVNSGSCRYGEKCTFAHGQHELREPPDLRSMMPQGMQGDGPGGQSMNTGARMNGRAYMSEGAPQMNGGGGQTNGGAHQMQGGPKMYGGPYLNGGVQGLGGLPGANGAPYQQGAPQGWLPQQFALLNMPMQTPNFN